MAMRLPFGLLVVSVAAGLLSVAAALLAMPAASLQFGLVMLLALLAMFWWTEVRAA